jgi:hypothetical protein
MLHAVVTDLNTVDEGHRGFYAEKDGKFVLQVTPAEGYELDNVSGLRSALGAERNIKVGLETKLKAFDGLDASTARVAIERIAAFGDLTPEQAQQAVETAATLSALDPAKEAERLATEKVTIRENQLKGIYTAKETELNTSIQGLQTMVGSLTGQLQNLMRDNQITSELAKLGPLDDARDAVELLARQSIKTEVVNGAVVVKVLDKDGHPRIKDANTDFTVADLLAELKEQRPGLFKAENKSGIGINPKTGAGGGTGQVNPWAKETFNRTEQGILTNTKPELAKQLKAQAGVS